MNQIEEVLFGQLKAMKIAGFPLLAHAGAGNFVALADKECAGGIQFGVHPAGKNRRKFNKIVIKYNAGDDLYDLELWNIKIMKGIMDEVMGADGLDVEQLYDALKGYLAEERAVV